MGIIEETKKNYKFFRFGSSQECFKYEITFHYGTEDGTGLILIEAKEKLEV